jgi:hypothetical protein
MYWKAEKSVLEVVSECLKLYFGTSLELNTVFRWGWLVVRGLFSKYGSLAYDFCVY